MRRILLGIIGCVGVAGFAMPSAEAAPSTLTFRYKHHLFDVPVRDLSLSEEEREIWTYRGRAFTPPAELRVDGDVLPELPDGVERTKSMTWSAESMKSLLSRRVALPLDREAGKVTIRTGSGGGYVFEGVGTPGRRVDLDALAALTAEALATGAAEVLVPVEETPPVVTVEDENLRKMGIKELVAFGESGFAGSPANRRHNIRTGLNRFNGHLIPQGTVFSFTEHLGPVDGTTGYLKELVIKGDRTVPDYGGGLCQVSSTAYRGAWEYGFPIKERRNHSYIVSYYGPVGTDATTYVPSPDIKFENDSPGALLIQTVMDQDRSEAYFLYYGTKDGRTAEVAGPYITNRTGPPPPRTETTTELPPGAKKVLGHAVPGMHVAWYRVLRKDGKETVEEFTSIYQARPDFTQIGAAAAPVIPPPSDGNIPEPSFF